MRRMNRARIALIVALAAALAAGKCGGGDGSGGSGAVASVESPDPRCIALPDPFGFPPAFDFVPGRPGRLLAATFTRPTLVPIDGRGLPFEVTRGADPTELPGDADGDGRPEPFQAIDDVFALDPDLALVTLSGYEAVLMADPRGGLIEIDVSVPAVFEPTDFRALPGPGESETRTGIANFTCIEPPPQARDSDGARLVDVLDPGAFCKDGVPSYRASFTSGAAVAADRLFVANSNLGAGAGELDTQYLPAALTVYDLARTGERLEVSPALDADGEPAAFVMLHEGGFNATHVQSYRTPGPDGREWILVTLTGAIGIVQDDPDTDVLESGAKRITDGSIDVVDPVGLRVVATIPLRGANPAFRGLAIDPPGRLGLVGDVTARQLYAVDLAPLDDLDPDAPGLTVLSQSVMFDGESPFRLPRVEGSPPEETCPGRVDSVTFNDAGDRAFALEVCDGSLISVDIDVDASASVPLPDRTLAPRQAVSLVAPLDTDTLGLTRQPSALQVREGVPGADFDGPDVFFLVGEPEALLCGIRIESP